MDGCGLGKTRAGEGSASFQLEKCFLVWSACVYVCPPVSVGGL